jgi:hypothetical protein
VSVSLFGDIVWISFVTDGVSRRHHRSPALAIEPAGQDPGRAHDPQPCRNSDALFALESQSFLANIVAGLRHSRAWKASLSVPHSMFAPFPEKSQGDYSSRPIGSKSVVDLKGLDEFRFPYAGVGIPPPQPAGPSPLGNCDRYGPCSQHAARISTARLHYLCRIACLMPIAVR